MRLRNRPQRRSSRRLVTFWRPRHEADYREGRIVNLSHTGCFIATERPFPPPATILMRLVIGEERLDIRAEVVRTVGDADSFNSIDGNGMGVRFQHPGSDAVAKLVAHRSRR